jgi:outer membrane protein TolC
MLRVTRCMWIVVAIAGAVPRGAFAQKARPSSKTDLQTAPARIQLETLLNDRTPIEQFDVTRPFEFTEQILMMDELHQLALANRPDLKAAIQAVDKAKTDYRLAVANGYTDPTFAMDLGRNPPIPASIGLQRHGSAASGAGVLGHLEMSAYSINRQPR